MMQLDWHVQPQVAEEDGAQRRFGALSRLWQRWATIRAWLTRGRTAAFVDEPAPVLNERPYATRSHISSVGLLARSRIVG